MNSLYDGHMARDCADLGAGAHFGRSTGVQSGVAHSHYKPREAAEGGVPGWGRCPPCPQQITKSLSVCHGTTWYVQ
jgi:hypothetical protein